MGNKINNKVVSGKEKDITKMIILSIIRIILTFLVVFYLKISPAMKIVLVMLLDGLDCVEKKMYNHVNFCPHTKEYQIIDKIVDTICYSMLLYYVVKNKLLHHTELYLLIGLFIYRLVGIVTFLSTLNRNFLVYFPNFFIETALLLFLGYHGIHKAIITVCIFIFKIIVEHAFHYNKKYFVDDY